LLLFVYVPLLSLTPQCVAVKSAARMSPLTAGNSTVSVSPSCAILTMVPSSAPAQATAPYPIFFQTHPMIWDPGGMSPTDPVNGSLSPTTAVPSASCQYTYCNKQQWGSGIPATATGPRFQSLTELRLTVVAGVELLTQSVCGRHMQLIVIVLQMIGGMISYAYQRPAIRPTRRPNNANLSWVPCYHAFVDQVPLLFHCLHPVLSRPTVPNI